MLTHLTPDDGLAPIPDFPGYARSESGRVYRFGHPRKGLIWHGLRPTAEITIDRTPGHVVIRRTGRFFFPLYRDGLIADRLFWQPPVEAQAPPVAPTEDDDDCPF